MPAAAGKPCHRWRQWRRELLWADAVASVVCVLGAGACAATLVIVGFQCRRHGCGSVWGRRLSSRGGGGRTAASDWPEPLCNLSFSPLAAAVESPLAAAAVCARRRLGGCLGWASASSSSGRGPGETSSLRKPALSGAYTHKHAHAHTSRAHMWTEGGRAFVFPPAWLPQFPLPSIHPCVPVYLPARLPARLPAKAFNLMHYSQSESDPS